MVGDEFCQTHTVSLCTHTIWIVIPNSTLRFPWLTACETLAGLLFLFNFVLISHSVWGSLRFQNNFLPADFDLIAILSSITQTWIALLRWCSSSLRDPSEIMRAPWQAGDLLTLSLTELLPLSLYDWDCDSSPLENGSPILYQQPMHPTGVAVSNLAAAFCTGCRQWLGLIPK